MPAGVQPVSQYVILGLLIARLPGATARARQRSWYTDPTLPRH